MVGQRKRSGGEEEGCPEKRVLGCLSRGCCFSSRFCFSLLLQANKNNHDLISSLCVVPFQLPLLLSDYCPRPRLTAERIIFISFGPFQLGFQKEAKFTRDGDFLLPYDRPTVLDCAGWMSIGGVPREIKPSGNNYYHREKSCKLIIRKSLLQAEAAAAATIWMMMLVRDSSGRGVRSRTRRPWDMGGG